MNSAIIGTETTYASPRGGCRVRINAIRKGALAAGYDPESYASYLTDDHDVATAGGVDDRDLVEISHWSHDLRRWSFVLIDVPAATLACFAHAAA